MAKIRFPEELADQCVQCGLCLPHCPTYRLERMESEGPRGRIAILQALARGQIEATPKGLAHLDHCLGCGHCERVCPAKVPYLTLRDHARAQRLTRTRRWRAWWLSAPGWRWLRELGLRILARLPARIVPGRWQVAQALAQTRPRAAGPSAAATTPRRTASPSALFAGCQNATLDPRALRTIQTVVAAVDSEVHLDASGACCGALAQHEGALTLAAAQRRRVAMAATQWIAIDSGCIADLRRTEQPVTEVCRWILDHWPADWALQPLPLHVALHTPCTHRSAAGDSIAVTELLRRIPALRISAVQGLGCCGAGGTHSLDDPDHARLFATALLREIPADATHLVSTNIGCRAHLRTQANRPQIVHPVELLAASVGLRPLPA